MYVCIYTHIIIIVHMMVVIIIIIIIISSSNSSSSSSSSSSSIITGAVARLRRLRVFRGKRLSNAARLTRVFYNSCESFSNFH